MLEPFNYNYIPTNQMKVSATGRIDYYLGRTKIDLEKVTEYYREKKRSTSNAHTLVRLLKKLNIRTNMSFIELLEMLDVKALRIAKDFGICSSISHCDYDKEDIYIYKDGQDYFNVIDWRSIQAMKPVYNNITNFTLAHPENLSYAINVSFLDVKMLAIQYWYYIKDAMTYKTSSSAQMFVFSYPLTNAIKDFFNLGIINLFLKNVEVDEYNTHPFYITNNVEYFIKEKDALIRYAHKKKINYTDLLKNIKIINGTGLTFYQTNFPYINNKNALIYFIIYTDVIKGVYDKVNKRSKRVILHSSLGFKLFYRYVKSTNTNMDTGLLENDKLELLEFANKIKG